jgi:hypothetical protein
VSEVRGGRHPSANFDFWLQNAKRLAGTRTDQSWLVGRYYLERGLALTRQSPRLYVAITCVYTVPALVSAWLVSREASGAIWQKGAAFGLSWITIVLGTVVIMVAVGSHRRGRLDLGSVSLYALSWLPRYLWTNAHTSVVFWGPIGVLLVLRDRQQQMLSVDGELEAGLNGFWWVLLGACALYLHARTLLAPFLAIHGDLPATLAAVEAWRLSGRALVPCLSTLVVASLPLLVPLLIVYVGVLHSPADELRSVAAVALPELIAAGIQLIRPVLVPAIYCLFTDLWQAESAQRAVQAAPPEPSAVRALMALTRPLPSLGRWP